MNVQPLDFSQVAAHYGSEGVKAAELMIGTLGEAVKVTYDPMRKTFTVLGTSGKSREELQALFEFALFEFETNTKASPVYIPSVLDQTDVEGNRLVKLVDRYTPQVQQQRDRGLDVGPLGPIGGYGRMNDEQVREHAEAEFRRLVNQDSLFGPANGPH